MSTSLGSLVYVWQAILPLCPPLSLGPLSSVWHDILLLCPHICVHLRLCGSSGLTRKGLTETVPEPQALDYQQ